MGEGQDSPVQSLNAIPTDDRAYGNKNILVMGQIDVPPVLAASDLLSFDTSEELRTTKFEYQASRKLDRSNQVLCLVINSDVSDVLRCFVQVRALLSYGS